MSDQWSGPAPIAQEYPANEPNGTKRLVDMVVGLKRDLRESTSNLLSTAGVFVTKLGLRISSALTVEGDLISTGSADITGTTHIGGATDIDGTLNVDAATTIGGTLGVTGVTTLGGSTTVNGALGVTGQTTLAAATSVTGSLTVIGPMAVTGTLSLPAGIIDNAALASPTMPDAKKAGSGTVGVTVTTTPGNYSTITHTVPAGFTSASVIGISTMTAGNPAAMKTVVGGNSGEIVFTNGINGNGTSAHTAILTGLSGGGTFTVTSNAYAASGSTICYIVTTSMVVFYR